MNLRNTIEKMVKQGASDLHLKVGIPPVLRIDGDLKAMKEEPLTGDDLRKTAASLMTREQQDIFVRDKEIDFAIGISGIARFRVNVYLQRGSIAVAMRVIPHVHKTIEELNLPDILKELSAKPRGIVLATGTTGSGKSTTLAAMIDYINEQFHKHIITIEDPIEYLFKDKESIISQREVGTDTKSFGNALRHILRQDPDVIFIGEIRDVETMDIALKAADTGHMVFSTLHTLNASETINRIISFYPPYQQQHIRVLMATTLVGVVSLRLLPLANQDGRYPAVEIMVSTPTIREYLLDPVKTLLIPQAIEEGAQYSMTSFDQSIMELYKNKMIDLNTAIENATNPDEFRLKIKGIESTSDRSWEGY